MSARDSVRSFFNGIGNLIAWAPTIWRDRDWDYCFLLEMLQLKLRRMGNQACRNVWSEEKAKQVLACADACKRILDNDYAKDEMLAHAIRWGDSVCPVCGKWACGCFPDYGTDGSITGHWLVMMYEKAHTSEKDQMAGEEFHDLIMLQGQMLQDDLVLICDMMKENLLSWWD